jgi:hypothetical protein
MSSTETPVWGGTTPPAYTPGEPPKRKTNRVATLIIALVAAVVLAGGGVAVAMAVNRDSSTTSSQAGPGGNGQGGFGGPGGMTGPGGATGLTGALHGDFTATADDGSYVTKRLQTGTVTEVSSTSITAKSADGHSTTFVVNSSTTIDNGVDAIGDVKTGDTVTVVGTVSSDTATATSIVDSTLNQANGNTGGNGMGNPPNQQSGTGS